MVVGWIISMLRFLSSKRLFLQLKQMSEARKRLFTGRENLASVTLKQTRLVFGGEKLMIEKLSDKEVLNEKPPKEESPARPPTELPDKSPKEVQFPTKLPNEIPDTSPKELPSLPKELPEKAMCIDEEYKSKSAILCSMEGDPKDLLETALAPLQGNSWLEKIEDELKSPYMQKAFKKLGEEAKKKKIIYPPINLVFNAFVLSPFDGIRVVILGQDPYHNVGQAHGLSFSVPPNVKQPPSLKNIFKELSKEYSTFVTPDHGSLVGWARQGVFLLNASLTVEKNQANSHCDIGWQRFTDFVIKTISQELSGVVFLLWGNFAQKKAAFVDKKKHAVIKTAHPSPLSYHKFTGSKCFTQTNEALIKMGKKPIDWNKL